MSWLHLLTEKVLLSFLIADQMAVTFWLIIFLGEIFPVVSLLRANNHPSKGGSWHQK